MNNITARSVALEVLSKVEKERSYSNLQLNQSLQAARLERADAALATEIVYGTIQRLNTLDWFLVPFLNKGIESLEPWVRSLLRMSLYQIHYLDRIPDHAVVNEAVELAKQKGHKGISGLVNGVLRSILRSKDQLTLSPDLSWEKRISLEHSHPEWLVQRWAEAYGLRETEQMCIVNNMAPPLSIRINPLKTTRDALADKLHEDGFDVSKSPLSGLGLLIHKGGNVATHPLYEAGHFSIQDESSMLVASVLKPEAGMTVLDSCAAPGGKTTHIAELMNNSGKIVACDIHKHKTKLIDGQANRLGISIIKSQQIDVRKLDETEPVFDRILVDAPCSGFGVIRRKPDLKWSKSMEDILNISKVQHSILDAVAPLVKEGGVLVYSTCTVDPEENEQVVERFLETHPQYQLDRHAFDHLPQAVQEQSKDGMLQLLPQHFNSDGFFISRMVRLK